MMRLIKKPIHYSTWRNKTVGKVRTKGLAILSLVTGLVLSACGDTTEATDNASTDSEKTNDYSIVMVTDNGGVDDGSFNQAAWEGMVEWGKEHDGIEGEDYTYIASDGDSEYIPNLNQAIMNDFDIVFGVGFKLKQSMMEIADDNPDQQFVIIDDSIEGNDNVASVLFKDQENAFLAGVAAALSTETGKIGFVAGQQSEVLDRFEAGFLMGAYTANPDVEVIVEYVESFSDTSKARQIAAGMYSNGVDIVYQGAGDAGNGVFSEARDRMNADPDEKIWVIGSDSDQTEEGAYNEGNLTLTSSIKGLGQAIKSVANQTMQGDFPGGEITKLGLKEEAIYMTRGQLSEETWTAMEEYKKQIINGDIDIPINPDEVTAP